MMQVEWQIVSQVATPKMSAQIRRHYWPEFDQTVDRNHYYLSLCTIPHISLIKPATGETTPLNAGTLSVLPPRFPVRIHAREGWEKSFVCLFHPSFFDEVTGLSEFWHSGELHAYSNIASPNIIRLMKSIYRELEEPGFASNLLVESAGNLALIELARYMRAAMRRPEISVQRGGLAPWQIKRITERIAASLELGQPTLQELAQLCGISEFHMMRNFKMSTGTTIHKCIEAVRLENAKQLLAEEGLSIKDIAHRLGFTRSTYFSTAFRRLTGISPSDFRRDIC